MLIVSFALVMVMKEYSTLSRFSELEPHHQMQFNIIPRKLLVVGVLSLCVVYRQHILSPYQQGTSEIKSFTKSRVPSRDMYSFSNERERVAHIQSRYLDVSIVRKFNNWICCLLLLSGWLWSNKNQSNASENQSCFSQPAISARKNVQIRSWDWASSCSCKSLRREWSSSCGCHFTSGPKVAGEL